VRQNDYNPNSVAPPEMALLEDSIRADGVTMGVVTFPLPEGGYEVVDGYHRRRVLTERFGARYLPIVQIDADRSDRIASTVRHNRARGKHSVDKMAQEIVGQLVAGGWDDARIGEHLGMSAEEVLRLRQIGGCAKALAGAEYSHPWRRGDATENPAHK
jgi:ParB-like chromosome segregation protein Spo0J